MHDREPSLGQRVTRLEVRIDERDTERFTHIDQRFAAVDAAIATLAGELRDGLKELRDAIQGLTWWAGGLLLASWVTIMVTIVIEGRR